MSGHDKKSRDGAPLFRARNASNTSSSSKTPVKITTPPRAALAQGRSASDKDESKSSKSTSPKTQIIPANEATQDLRPTEVDAQAATSKRENDQELVSLDLKISRLEKESGIMEEEFTQELNHLSNKLTSETEKVNFWEKKYSTLNQLFLKADTDFRVLQHDYGAREKQLEERDRDIKTRISSLKIDRDFCREGYNNTQRELMEKEREIAEYRNQIRDLKKFVSTSTRTEGQMTDEVFGEMMQKLGNELQNWVISNFKKPKIDLSKLGADSHENLFKVLPNYTSLETVSKFHLIQSIVSVILVSSVFNQYFAGLPGERCAALADMEQYIGSLGSGASVNQWRSTTLAIVKKDAIDNIRVETESLIETVIHKLDSILNFIMDLPNSGQWKKSVRNIIIDAIGLSQLLRVQKAAFRVNSPVINEDGPVYFDAQSMEDVGGEDDVDLEKRKIRCVTWFGIMKEGDENGGQLHLTNVVAKARVLCEPE